MTTTTTAGRQFLLARPGQRPFHDPLPCYLMTLAEAEEAQMSFRVAYGQAMDIVRQNVVPNCDSNYPGNGSNCELRYGHAKDCCYEEPNGKLVRWTKEGGES